MLAADIFGKITAPDALNRFGTDPGGGIGALLNTLLKGMIVIAGVWTLINLVLAGYGFLAAGDDPKKITGAWSKIWQSLLGLAIAAGSFTLAAIFGQLIFGKWDFILNPAIPIP
jgi:hypothetical protein